MISCPHCGKETSQNFGMVTCEGCSQVFMIDFSGNVEVAEEAIDESNDQSTDQSAGQSTDEHGYKPTNEPVDQSIDQSSGPPPDSYQPEVSPTSGWDHDTNLSASDLSSPMVPEEVLTEDLIAKTENQGGESTFNFVSELNREAPTEPFEPSSSQSPDGAERFIEGLEDNDISDSEPYSGKSGDHGKGEPVSEAESSFEVAEQDLPPIPQSLREPSFADNSTRDPRAPLDITPFANDTQAYRGGGLTYELLIEGIDDQHLREQVSSVLAQPRLKLSYEDLISQMDQGRIRLLKLSPLKAKRIVEQLQFFDLRLSWVQRPVIME